MMNESKYTALKTLARSCGVDGAAQPDGGWNKNQWSAWGSRVSVRRLAASMGFSFERKNDLVTHLYDGQGFAGSLVSDSATGRASMTVGADCAERALA